MFEVLTNPLVKLYINNALTETQQVWLSYEIMNHPERFPTFLISKQGKDAFQCYFDAYKRYAQPKAALLKKQEDHEDDTHS